MTPYERWRQEREAWCLYRRPPITSHYIYRKRFGWELVWRVQTESADDALRAITECS